MSEERDKRFVVLALERGLVSAEQVEACRRLQSQAPEPPPSLLQLLLQQGHLSREQVVQLASSLHLPDLEQCVPVQDLGAGTLGSTCVVQDGATGKRYALKILGRSLIRDPGFAEQVHKTAALAARISHLNVVRVLGAGEKLGDLYVVSEHVEGASLEQLLAAKGKLEPHEALSVGLAAAQALEQAVALGLTHGAISPRNLLVAQDGSVKLADLGIPRPRAEVSVARTGEGVRSPSYLPPEYFDPRAPLDVRSDLFSLGAVLYQCLSGQVPFHGDTTAEVIFAIRNGVCRPLREAAPGVPLSLTAVVEKLLQSDPSRRYESPAALLADLQAVQAHRVPEAQRKALAEVQAAKQKEPEPQPLPAETPPPPRRRWPWVLLAAGVALAAAAATAVALLPRQRAKAKPAEEEPIEPAGPADLIALAKKGREEIEAVKPRDFDAPDGSAKKLEAVQSKIEKLKEIQQKYKRTGVEKEAEEKLAPLIAEELFEKALAYAREHPRDADGIAKRFGEIHENYGNTQAGYKAEQELEKVEGADRKKLQADLEEARQRAKALTDKKRFGEALAAFDELHAANPPEAIKQSILLEKNAIASEAERAYQDAHRRAQEKIGGKYYEDAKGLYDQVAATFGLEPFVGRAKAEIAIIAPLLKSAAARRLEAIDEAKYRFFLTRVEPARAFARSWDLAGASREAEKIRPELRTAGIEAYLDSFLDDVKLLTSLKRRVIRRLSDQAAPVLVRHFSLGKLAGKFDPQWLEAQALRADDTEAVFRYGQLEVQRAWAQFPPDELYKLGNLASDPNDPQGHLVLGIHCLYADLLTLARREFHLAKAQAPEAESYLQRVELALGATKAGPARTKDEEASQLLLEAKRFMNEQAWDRALYRLALLKDRHAKSEYNVSANLPDINQRIAACKKQVEKLEIESDLALGREVALLRDSLFDDWQQRFGTWTLEKGVLRGKNTEDHDAECLFALRHPPAYELRVKVRVTEGPGAILRLAGKARPNIGFWIHTAKPDLVGLLYAQPDDKQADERATRPFTFQPNTDYELCALVSPARVEVRIVGATGGADYAVRMPNKLQPDPSGLQTYGVLVSPKSAAEFRDFSVRALREQ